ncbi:MAG: hypothetical protein FK731_06315 [Asgard group archaeon]|nr:hypothetical protein [Asgard group archaeon]
MTFLTTNVLVPSQDSANNTVWGDVIGNKTDTHNGNSLVSKTETLLEHVHGASKVYPTLANGVTVTTGVGAWTLGNFVEIVPSSTITSDFDIHWVSIESISANDVYELVLYKGALTSEIEVGRVRFTKNAALDSTLNIPMQTSIIDANERVSAKIASSSGSDNATISLFYHTY